MKKIIIIVPFIFAFIFVTGALVYLNSMFNNIFQFDFTPRTENNLLTSADSLALKDSLNFKGIQQDTTQTFTEPDTINQKLNSNQDNLVAQVNPIKEKQPEDKTSANDLEKAKKDSAYTAWLKKTVKLVENLPPAQASKLLKNYSDNQARDIIYAMKQKQAAKIISYLEPEYVHKITRFQ